MCSYSLCLSSAAASSSSRFVWINEQMSWSEAQTYCRQHYTDLAIVRSTAEKQQIQDIMANNGWIGLFRGSSSWSDGSSSSFTYWASGQPDNPSHHCVRTLRNGARWEDDGCTSRHPFFCHGGKLCVSVCINTV